MHHMICGRAHRLWTPMVEEIGRLYAQGERVTLLVPEQYTLQAERDLMRDLGLKGFFRLDVLSPSRLEYRVFDALGQDARVRIDERGRAMTIARALRKARKQLRYYAGAEDNPGFIRRMASLVASFKSLGLDADALETAAERFEGGLRHKLQDSSLVMAHYERLLEGRFADQQDIHREMLSRLAGGRMFAGRHVYVYGFDLITAPMLELLLALGRQCQALSVYLVSERAQAEDGDCFEAVRLSAQRLLDAWREQGMPHRFQWLPEKPVSPHPELQHLEKHLLGMEQPVYAQPVPRMRLYAASTAHREVWQAAAHVLEELRRGTDPEDIYVLVGSLPVYGALIRAIFGQWGIPHHISDKLPLTAHRLARHLLAALRCAADGYRHEDVAELLRAGLTNLTQEEAWALEDYAIGHGIRTSRWSKPFARGTQEARTQAEALRLKLIPPLERLKAALLAARSTAQSLDALRAYLKEEGFVQKAEAMERQLVQAGMLAQAAQVPQVLDRLTEMLEQMGALMGEERIPLNAFALWLQSGLQEAEIGSLPPESGRVQVGQLGNLLLPRPAVLLLLGLHDDTLDVKDSSLLSPREHALAEDVLRLQLELDLAGKQELKLLDAWKALSAPRERLYLSYALANEEGGAQHPLQLLGALRRMFPQLREEGGSQDQQPPMPPAAPAAALEAIAPQLRHQALTAPWAEVWGWLLQTAPWQHLAGRLLMQWGPQPLQADLPPGMLPRLYPEDRVNVTRLERFAACPFQHFVEHGLRPQVREEWIVEPVDTGSFFHQAMEAYMRLALADPRWPDVDEAHSDRLLDQAIQPLIACWQEGPFLDTARQRKASQGYVALTRHAAWMLTRGLNNSEFRPEGIELRFGGPQESEPLLLRLPQGRDIGLSGTIDRVDRYQGQLGDYLRVLDYKSSEHAPIWEEIWQGTQLQLLIYLKRAMGLYAHSEPAGAFYQRLSDSLVSCEDAQTAGKEREKAYRLRGIAIDNPDVVRLMDRDEALSLGKVLTASGEPDKRAPLVPAQDLRLLANYSVHRAQALAQRMLGGEIARRPIQRQKGGKPCDYCLYQGICRIDPSRPEAFVRLAPMSREELLQRAARALDP